MNERQLYYGDNLDVLRKYFRDDTVDLCYIDPPFNSKRNYNQIYNNLGKEDQAQAQAFVDTWTWDTRAIEGFDDICSNRRGILTKQTIELLQAYNRILGKGSLLAYLVSMTLRIAEIWRALKSTGSFYLHCDPTCSHYLKLLLDSIFCSQGGDFKNDIIWVRSTNPKGSQFDNKKFSPYTDNILFYTKSNQNVFNEIAIKRTLLSKEIEKKYDRKDEQGRFTDAPILRSASMGERPNLVYQYKGYTPDAYGWRVEQTKLAEIDRQGNLGWSTTGKPFRKLRPSDDKGHPVGNFWNDISLLNSQSAERLGYPTQKPEALLERIIKVSSNEEDTILDAYCGCGTTIATAERLKRHWRGIDITYQSISVILKRLEEHYGKELVAEIQLNGVPQDMAAAKALALKQDDRVRKEFEKWAVLTYTNNRAVIHEKKGGDKGIDGIAFVQESADDYKQVILSVKSGKLQPSMVRDLHGTVEREQAAMGILLTLERPHTGILNAAKEAGIYRNPLMTGQTFEKLQVVSVEDLLAGKRLQLPMTHEVLKKAKSQTRGGQDELFG